MRLVRNTAARMNTPGEDAATAEQDWAGGGDAEALEDIADAEELNWLDDVLDLVGLREEDVVGSVDLGNWKYLDATKIQHKVVKDPWAHSLRKMSATL